MNRVVDADYGLDDAYHGVQLPPTYENDDESPPMHHPAALSTAIQPDDLDFSGRPSTSYEQQLHEADQFGGDEQYDDVDRYNGRSEKMLAKLANFSSKKCAIFADFLNAKIVRSISLDDFDLFFSQWPDENGTSIEEPLSYNSRPQQT